MANFNTEREGQIEFYQTFLPLVAPTLGLDEILADDNDGVLNGNLLEFKLRVNDLNAVLFQCVKYLCTSHKGQTCSCKHHYRGLERRASISV